MILIEAIDGVTESGRWAAGDRYALVTPGEHVFTVRRRIESVQQVRGGGIIGISRALGAQRDAEILGARSERLLRLRVDSGFSYEIYGSDEIGVYFVDRFRTSEKRADQTKRSRSKAGLNKPAKLRSWTPPETAVRCLPVRERAKEQRCAFPPIADAERKGTGAD